MPRLVGGVHHFIVVIVAEMAPPDLYLHTRRECKGGKRLKILMRFKLKMLLFYRTFTVFIIISFLNLVTFFAITPSYAQEKKDALPIEGSDKSGAAKITTETGFFSHKYFFDNEQLMSEKDFEKVLSRHSAALKEYKRSRPYAHINLVAMIAMTALVVKQLSDTMKQADDPLNESGSGWSDVTLVAISGGVAVVSGMISSKHFKNGIEIFNKKQDRNARLMKQSKSDSSHGLGFGLYISHDNSGMIQDYNSKKGLRASGLVTYSF